MALVGIGLVGIGCHEMNEKDGIVCEVHRYFRRPFGRPNTDQILILAAIVKSPFIITEQ